MQHLIDGIHHFQRESFLPLQKLFERLAEGQHPDTLFITCSDSRIDPTLLTNAQPGELFILRNAGNIIPPHGAGNGGEAATVEFAVSVLSVKDIIICGHSHCGAMRGLLHPESLASLPDVSSWLSHAEMTRRIISDNYSDLDGEALLTATIEENVLVQLENLRTLPAVGSRLVKGDIHLHGWVYIIETGKVFAYDVESGQFVKLAEHHVPEIETSLRRRPTQII
ncbi:MAG: carbonate dehydratase [Planctomycetales bacterium 12-60-4]|nr:MAG: carbonate dehydratase [Planctomycetales bacterium 12-60-4]